MDNIRPLDGEVVLTITFISHVSSPKIENPGDAGCIFNLECFLPKSYPLLRETPNTGCIFLRIPHGKFRDGFSVTLAGPYI